VGAAQSLSKPVDFDLLKAQLRQLSSAIDQEPPVRSNDHLRAERADQAVVGGELVPGHLAAIHDVRQAGKHRVGEPMTAQIVPNPLDRIELRAVRRQLQQSDIARHHEPLATVPAGTIEV
jgi:hypothetical protein